MRIAGNIILFCLVTITALISCSKGGGPVDDDPRGGNGGGVFVPTDTIAPQITINTPTEGQLYQSGGTIGITGKITDDYGLYQGTIKIVSDANGAVYLNQAYEIHGLLTYNFSLNQPITVNTSTNFTVTVSFEDHGLNRTTKSVKINVSP